MPIIAYNSSFERIDSGNKSIEFIEAAWNRKLTEPGDFMIYMTLTEYNRLKDLDVKYFRSVYSYDDDGNKTGADEIGIIQKVKYSRDKTGKYITLSGFFLEKLLSYCARRKTTPIDCTDGSGVIQQYETKYLSYCDGVAGKLYPLGQNGVNLIFVSGTEDFTDSTFCYTVTSDSQAGEVLYNILEDRDYRIYAVPKIESGHYGLNIYVKATSDKTTMVFAESSGTLSDLEYEIDESAVYCNYCVYTELAKAAYIATRDEYDAAWIEMTNNEKVYKVAMYYPYMDNQPEGIIDAYPYTVLAMTNSDTTNDDIDLESTTQATVAAIQARMNQTAKSAMASNCAVSSITATIQQTGDYEYLTDYDIGDKVKIKVDAFGINYTARITEIIETHKNGMIEVELKLGSVQAPNSYKKSTTSKKKTTSETQTEKQIADISDTVDTLRGDTGGGGSGWTVLSVDSLPETGESQVLYLLKG